MDSRFNQTNAISYTHFAFKPQKELWRRRESQNALHISESLLTAMPINELQAYIHTYIYMYSYSFKVNPAVKHQQTSKYPARSLVEPLMCCHYTKTQQHLYFSSCTAKYKQVWLCLHLSFKPPFFSSPHLFLNSPPIPFLLISPLHCVLWLLLLFTSGLCEDRSHAWRMKLLQSDGLGSGV